MRQPCVFCGERMVGHGIAGVRQCHACMKFWAVEDGMMRVWREPIQGSGWGELCPVGCLYVVKWEGV